MRFNINVAAIVLALVQTCHGLRAMIVADTNRDGKIEPDDLKGKDTWTEQRGAVFLANIGDSNRRCAKEFGISMSTPDDEIDKCHDASDNIQRNSKYLAPIWVMPNRRLSKKACGSIWVRDKAASKLVRIFVQSKDKWTYVAPNHTFSGEELRNGLRLGIDARDVRRPTWDGKVTVHYTLTDGDDEASDSVALRVAPLLTHHHLQKVKRVFTTTPNQDIDYAVQFVEDLQNHTAAAGIDREVYQIPGTDNWTQDFFEPAYTSIPGSKGPEVLRVMIRSAQRNRKIGRYLFAGLRSSSVGAVQFLQNAGTLDSTGNIETIPPYDYNGKSFPAGRIIMGTWGGKDSPLIVPFLEAQGKQKPILLNTEWLTVGHVDEFLHFLPAKNKLGWVLMVADPLAGVKLLKQASAMGLGDQPAYSRPKHDYDMGLNGPTATIDEHLTRENFAGINQRAAKYIQANIEILKKETGIDDDEIYRVPSLFYYKEPVNQNREEDPDGPKYSKSSKRELHKRLNQIESIGQNKLERRSQPDPSNAVVALYPAAINGIVLTKSYYLAPNPWGPIIKGRDIFASATTAVYAKVGYKVHFMDDFFSHHFSDGEIHCGTQVWRETKGRWW